MRIPMRAHLRMKLTRAGSCNSCKRHHALGPDLRSEGERKGKQLHAAYAVVSLNWVFFRLRGRFDTLDFFSNVRSAAFKCSMRISQDMSDRRTSEQKKKRIVCKIHHNLCQGWRRHPQWLPSSDEISCFPGCVTTKIVLVSVLVNVVFYFSELLSGSRQCSRWLRDVAYFSGPNTGIYEETIYYLKIKLQPFR